MCQIVDHGVPKEVIDACWQATEDLFDRPLHEKLAVPMTDDYPYGYTAMGQENLLASLDEGVQNPPDMKEMFNVCLGSRQPAPDHPPPCWPAESQPLQAAYEAYYRALEGLAATLYRVCARALGLPEDWFDDKITQHRNVIRAIHYPCAAGDPWWAGRAGLIRRAAPGRLEARAAPLRCSSRPPWVARRACAGPTARPRCPSRGRCARRCTQTTAR